MNFQALNKQRKFILIGAAAGIIAMFLPWISISIMGISQSANGFRSYGIAVFLGFVAAGIISIIGDQEKALDKNLWLAALIAGAVSILFTVIFIANISNVAGGGLGLVDAGFGFGIWIALIASLAVLGSAWMFKNPADNLKDSFDSVKKSISIPASTAPGTSNTQGSTNKIAELERLSKLKENGSITEEEYQQLKSKIL